MEGRRLKSTESPLHHIRHSAEKAAFQPTRLHSKKAATHKGLVLATHAALLLRTLLTALLLCTGCTECLALATHAALLLCTLLTALLQCNGCTGWLQPAVHLALLSYKPGRVLCTQHTCIASS
eukprot:1150373-Pelagomonas_calceolata.AAC.4